MTDAERSPTAPARKLPDESADRPCGDESEHGEPHEDAEIKAETADDYFDYYRRRHAFWKMYGLDLPDDVLKKLYYKNALRVIPGIDPTLFPDG